MSKIENISYYEKLHDLFGRVHPKDMPKKIAKTIEYLEKAASHHAVNVSDVTSVLYDMQDAFTFALERKVRSLLLTDVQGAYEVNLYPIINFLRDNSCLMGDLDNLKSRLITLAYEKNIAEMKDIYKFVDDLSVTFQE